MKATNYISFVGVGLVLLLTACEKKFLDLDPLDQPTEAVFFQTPDQFKAAANDFYNKMIGFRPVNSSSIYDFMDIGSDLTTGTSSAGQGTNGLNQSDIYWNNPYTYIRANNILLKKVKGYQGSYASIRQYAAAAYFFRAWHHFFLLQRYGGVPIDTIVADVNSPLLNAPRNNRYEVSKQILTDLDSAIAGLPAEAKIASGDKGQVSQQAAKAFKARVLLYEGTWEKYVKETTDFAAGQGKGNNTTAYLTEAAALASQVMSSSDYQLFNGVDSLSTYYLYVLEDAASNPKGLNKSANKEFILSSKYDYSLLQGNANLTHTVGGLGPSRKMMDMYLCKDGLPYSVSPLAKGYAAMTDEFQNRDWRLRSLVNIPSYKYWGFGTASGADYTKANYFNLTNFPSIIATYYPNLSTSATLGGYSNRKFSSEHPVRADYQESYDYPQIRLAEVYLIYAEAKCELGNGTISDTDLDLSINKIRARAGVARLTNALIAPYPSLTMLGEIRRERALELFMENSRFNDLKRWAIAEQELNQPIEGAVISYQGKPTELATFVNPASKIAIYKASVYPFGVDPANGALIIDPVSNRKFARKNYLYPLPIDQLNLNRNLVQNPGW
ncbi:RagB/SusD family nutrient uptake outer membrane protein [Spirosoma sp.]|uniref:RagB/SusD family nutrient uptake outer membrane protein n=1 Tax=Spirosoma sp. TaxID=1899569 RepID=UPI00262A9AAF|nr:RagB/SusD family nutrient uptake outer membrane protein [Spirosoma sp.]MCX6215788.1 RagB/SusD family nutrient uptake outer membrane protein [Spirosoma sp.]